VRPSGTAEVGWHEVELNDAGLADPVVGVLPEHVDAFQWHYYTFDLPPQAELLASSPAAGQAYRIDEQAWGIQFHAEVTREMVETWLVAGEQELPKPIDEVRSDTDRLLGAWNRQGRALCEAFLTHAAR
jgi:GMP synthase-like glutamine amidotransferase